MSLIDNESLNNGSPESLVRQQSLLHGANSRYLEVVGSNTYQNLNNPTTEQLKKCFGIKHFFGNVIYDTNDFIHSNADKLCDDIVAIFHKSTCSFGFVTHLFGAELRVLKNKGSIPLGLKFRVSPIPHFEYNNVESVSTFTQDFHSRLDYLLRTLVHARPHFIRCIKVLILV